MKQSFGQKGAGGRFLALVLALIMLCSVLPLSYAAAVDEQGTAEQTAETKVEAAAAGVTYIFYVGETKYYEDKVLSGSVLTKPADPAAPEGKIFKGWFVDNDVNRPFTFGTVVSTHQDETVALYAQFEAAQPAAAQQPEASKTDDVQQPAEQQPEQTGSTEAPKQDETNNTDANTPTGGEENKGEEPTGTENNENQTGENQTPGEPTGGENTTPTEPTPIDEFYNRLIACSTLEEMNAILNNLTEEENALLEQFTKEQNAALITKTEELDGYGFGTLAGKFTLDFDLTNVTIAYVYFNKNNQPGEFTVFTTGQTITLNKDANYRVMFFVKPNANHLLTTFKDKNGTARDFYPIGYAVSSSALNGYGDYAQGLVTKAAGLGYVGYFGYSGSYDTQNDGYSSHVFVAQQPKLTVTATPTDPNVKAKPGEKVQYTVTITPEVIQGATITSVSIKSLKVSGKDVVYGELTKNTDGSYSLTIEYEVTNEDWENSSAKLTVEADVGYRYDLPLSNQDGKYTGTITTTTTVSGTAETDIRFASKAKLIYKVAYEGKDTHPDALDKKIPVDTEDWQGNTATVDTVYGRTNPTSPYEDTDGTWTFDGWYLDEDCKTKAGETVSLGEDGKTLYGKWTFESNAKLIVKKEIGGNLVTPGGLFTFTYTVKDEEGEEVLPAEGETYTFTLSTANNYTFTIENLPVGGSVELEETNASGYHTWYQNGETFNQTNKTNANESTDKKHKITLVSGENYVVCYNEKDIVPDTGLFLDSWPYLIALGFVTAGAVLTLAQRRRRDVD